MRSVEHILIEYNDDNVNPILSRLKELNMEEIWRDKDVLGWGDLYARRIKE